MKIGTMWDHLVPNTSREETAKLSVETIWFRLSGSVGAHSGFNALVQVLTFFDEVSRLLLWCF